MEDPAFLMAERKVIGGKLVRVKAIVREGALAEVRIEGDFFVHPEEGLAKMEGALAGLSVEGVREGAETVMGETMAKEGIVLIGFGPQDVAELLEEICSGTAGA
jgi:lipoate-protein ligase A